MRALLSLLLFCLVGLGLSAPASNPSNVPVGDGRFRVDFVGASGQIRFYPNSTNDNRNFKIKWSKLQEVDPAGNVIASVNNFAGKTFTWNGPSSVNISGYPATQVTLSANAMDVNPTGPAPAFPIDFSVSASMFNAEVTIPYGNTTVTIPQNTMKFTVSVSGWQFKQTNNSLVFGATLQITGTGSTTPASVSYMQSDKVYYGSSSIDLPTTAVVDGNTKTIQASAASDGSEITWVFPSFTSTLVYDPTIAMSNGAATNTLSLIMAAVLMIVALFSSKQF